MIKPSRDDRLATIRGVTTTGAEVKRDGGIQSVARALSILELFSDRQPSLTTNEIAALTGLNRGTAYRFCQTLRQLGYLEEIRQSTFRPGLKVLSLAQAAVGGRQLVDVAMPSLQSLRHDIDMTVNLAIPDGDEVVYLARLLNDDLLALRLTVGSRLPIVSSSLGRAILAFMDEAEQERMLGASITSLTSHTITDVRALRTRLADVRRRGYAINDQEVAVGARGLAAPVFGRHGVPVAAINISTTKPLDELDVEGHLAPRLMQAAADIGTRAQHLDTV